MGEKCNIEKRLAAYAAVATGAGVSLAASAKPANAEVVFTPSNVQITCHSQFSIDMNNDGITDFKFDTFQYTHTFDENITGRRGNAVMAVKYIAWAYALLPHTPIVPTRNFRSVSMSNGYYKGALLAGADISGSIGEFGYTRNRAIGVRFQINGQNHYGWIGIRQFFEDGCNFTLAGWAYETIPNRPLRAGQTGGESDDPTLSPQSFKDSGESIPATPAVLSLGAEGLRLWRKQGN